ncbi:hypothetical protein MPSEU_000827000 [Mayamaea pseudoterrestris]|nr:hypothetical protein MPSEU_000827000 [Mayamaea pseudoterrestris]
MMKQASKLHPSPFRAARVIAVTIWLLSCCSMAFLSSSLRPKLVSCLPVAKEPLSHFNANYPAVNGDAEKPLVLPFPPRTPTRFASVKTDQPPMNLDQDGQTKNDRQQNDAPICRVVTRSDSKLDMSCLTNLKVDANSTLLASLDSIYHAMAHEETRQLQYMQQHAQDGNIHDQEEEKKLVALTRNVLEDAGFQRLSRRDIDLCDALNAGYLLRLSLQPDTRELDPDLFGQFYPELVREDGKLRSNEDELLFEGRVLVYWRDYSAEVSQGRLLLPKLDYLQASLVQRSAAFVRLRLNVLERWIVILITDKYRRIVQGGRSILLSLLDSFPKLPAVSYLRLKIVDNAADKIQSIALASSRGKLFTLSRYGGSKMRFMGAPDPADALNPFIVCRDGINCCDSNGTTEIGHLVKDAREVAEEEMYQLLNKGELKCPYDDVNGAISQSKPRKPSMQLLKRVSIGNLVNLFRKDMRRKLLETLVSKSKLVEPTYKEVVVVWRPLPAKESRKKPALQLPPWVYDVADMFDIGGLPPRPSEPPEPVPKQMEIRAFNNVPMANLPAVLPKTRLIFRPADAFVFDSVTLLSLALVVSSFKFDNPRLDLLALVTGTLWIIRTFFRYSNKLARYDLLVKTFLTTKITHRNMGALKYVATEAGSQRALRASLFHTLLSQKFAGQEMESVERSELMRVIKMALAHDLNNTMLHHDMDLNAAFNDLEDLRLIRSTRDGRYIVVRDSSSVLATLKKAWCNLFDGKVDLRTLFGRRNSIFNGDLK